MHIPVDSNVKELKDIPYTLSYVIRKREQIDSFNELSKEKRPPLRLIWDAPVEELEEWLENVMDTKQDSGITIFEDDIER